MLKHMARTHRGGTSQTPLSNWGALLIPREPATQAVRDGRDRPALILIPVMCCMLRWIILGGRFGLGIVMCPLLRSASSLACLLLISHISTGHRALGRRAYLTLLGPAIQPAKALCQLHVSCMGTCRVTLAFFLPYTVTHMCHDMTGLAIMACGDCLPWTHRSGTRYLGRCLGSNQVRSVPSSSDGG